MKKKWLKKGSAVLLTAAMVLSLFSGMKGTLRTVQAAGNGAPASGYWTDATGLKGFNLSSSTAIGKIRFGASDRIWAICGTDGDKLALLSTSEFAQAAYGSTSEYSSSNFVNNLKTDSNGYLSTTYFSTGERDKMADVTVSTNEPDGSCGNHLVSVENKKLYLPNSQDQNINGTTIYVGSSNNIAVNVTKLNGDNGFQTNRFWLRSPFDSSSSGALVACPGYFVGFDINVGIGDVSVVPALNLNLSSDIFASAADAASSSYTGYKANSEMTANTYTLRYESSGTEKAVIGPDGTTIQVTDADGKYLMVQNSTGVYALAITSADQTVSASDIQMGNQESDKLENFNNCKVWIESTDADRITTAKMATQATAINSVAVTDITSPAAGSALDTQAACATTGVYTTVPTVTWKQGETPATGNAGYNTTYTASVNLTAADNYEFASGVTATVNGQNATGVTKNSDGTVTVTYSYKTVAKTVSNAYYATADDLKDCYNIGDGTIGKIRFGLNGSDARLWAICGADTDGSLSLLSTSEFAQAAYGSTSEYSSSNFVNNLKTDSNGYLSTTYFSTGEMGKMADVTVSTNEPDTTNGGNHTISVENKKLYLPNSQDQNIYGTTIYVGSSNNIAVNVTKLNGDNGFQTNRFWLRSPRYGSSGNALVAYPGIDVDYDYVYYYYVSVVPALNLNLSSDIFASAADAASSSYSGYKANSVMTANTYTLRYTYTDGTDSAVINPSGTQVKVTGASDKYLMVQNSTGVYALAITSADQTVNASDIIMGSALTTFDGCKVWIESTDADRITTAKLATQATAINSVAVTDITAPVAGSTFDTTSACATRGVYTTVPTVTWKQGDVSATGNAGYNTTYTASVTLTKTDDYEFAAGVTATVNGQNATSVVKNGDGTVTITYTFPATAKAKLTNITAPTGITVASGTAYANMGLPNNVAIVTEGNTETTAAVVWNTTTPASGSYNPEVLTQQSVTLNGTVTCPSNIDQNSVPLTTTITVTISAAGIVGAPTFVPAAGTYTENQSVSLSSSTDGATIYYTTDGTTPTAASNVYSGAITVTGIPGERISTTIKAIAVKPGMQNSSVASAAYVIELPAPAPSTYAVTVNNGTGDGCYTAGATVTITADTASSGHEFDKWTVVSGGVTLASATSATTTFEMPANAVEVTATYKNKPSDQNPPTPTYTITAGAGGTHELSTDGTLTITCAGSLDKLTGIYVDDKLVNASNYTLKSGSTILTFNATYLNTLSVGTHKVKFQYSDGSVETTFVINEASTQDTTNSSKKDTTQDTTQNTTQETTTPSETVEAPKTGDSTPIVWWFIIAIISGAGVVYFGRKKKTVR